MRTCVGCRSRRPADELRRCAVVEAKVRFGRTLPGRGAWLCPDRACWDSAIRRRALFRALRCDTTIEVPSDPFGGTTDI